jgi:hypothetical protein
MTPKKSQNDGSWKLEWVKAGYGFKPVFQPSGYAPRQEGPAFPTEEEAQNWIDEKLRAA